MGSFLFIAWGVLAATALLSNRDIFSPVKFYVLFLFVFFADIFVNDYSFAVRAVYLGLVVTGLVLAIKEGYLRSHMQLKRKQLCHISTADLDRITWLIWLVSLLPLVAQYYVISLFGGLEPFVNSIGIRVLEHRGLGPIFTVIKLFPVLNVMYFAAGLFSRSWRPLWWLLYAVHLALFVLIGLLSGSRGVLLNNFAVMLIAFHYLRRPVPLRTALLVACSLVAFAGLLGVARTGYSFAVDGFQTGLRESDRIFQFGQSDYGPLPLELVLEREVRDPRCGLTFLTVFTNVIPRSLWPGKPDTGGVVLTVEYTGNAWDGTSNLSTGLIAESVLNFGRTLGVLFGFLFLYVIFIWVIMRYVHLVRLNSGQLALHDALRILSYAFCAFAAANFLSGEFTNTVLALIVNKLGPLYGLAMVIFPGKRRRNAGTHRHNTRHLTSLGRGQTTAAGMGRTFAAWKEPM